MKRQEQCGEGIGVTSSVLTGIGHKDDVVAKIFAETVAKKMNCTVVCACGIHMDHIEAAQIEIVKEKSKSLLEKVLVYIEKDKL